MIIMYLPAYSSSSSKLLYSVSESSSFFFSTHLLAFNLAGESVAGTVDDAIVLHSSGTDTTIGDVDVDDGNGIDGDSEDARVAVFALNKAAL